MADNPPVHIPDGFLDAKTDAGVFATDVSIRGAIAKVCFALPHGRTHIPAHV